MFWKKKQSQPQYKCSQCGEVHEGWPTLSYEAPWHYSQLREEESSKIAKINPDFCEIHWEEQTDRFIRTTLVIPVHNCERNLEYGVWVSLSEKSFNDYSENYDRIDHETGYFGWICNNLLGYEHTLEIPTDVLTQTGNRRPKLNLHQNYNHPLVLDYIHGITKKEAEHRIHEMLEQSINFQ